MAKGKVVNSTPSGTKWWWEWRGIRPQPKVGEIVKLSDRSYKVDKNGSWRRCGGRDYKGLG